MIIQGIETDAYSNEASCKEKTHDIENVSGTTVEVKIAGIGTIAAWIVVTAT